MASQCKWKSFCLGDLFDIDNLWVYGKNKQYKTHLDYPNINSIPVVSGTVSNNGVNYYTIDNLDKNEIFSDCLTINTRGQAGQCFYHDGKFCLANNILAMPMPGLNKNTQLFFAVAISKLPYGDNYSNYPTKESLKKDCIMLPSTPDGAPDFDYMTKYIAELETKYIAELETKYIAELETYLKVTGLDDYTLTDSDKDVLSRMADGRVAMGKFRIGDLFKKADIRNKKGFNKRIDASNARTKEFNVPIINAKHGNNGIMFYGRDSDCNSIEGTIGIVQNGAIATGDVYPHPEKTGVLWDAYLIKPFYGMSTELLIYFSCAIQKAIKAQYSYDNKSYWELVQNNIIVIPITPNGTPDYAFIEQYIRAVEKQTIAKLYDSHTMEIQTAKEIIDSDI